MQISGYKHLGFALVRRADGNQVIPDTPAIIDGDGCQGISGGFLRLASHPVLFLSAYAYQEDVSLSLAGSGTLPSA